MVPNLKVGGPVPRDVNKVSSVKAKIKTDSATEINTLLFCHLFLSNLVILKM